MTSSSTAPRSPSRLRWFLAGVFSSSLISLVTLVFLINYGEARANHASIQDIATVASELRAIMASLKAHHESRGQYPATLDEWRETEPDLDELLTTKSAATEPRYFIDLAALGDPDRIVTMVPNRDLRKYVPDVPFINWRGSVSWAQSKGSRYTMMGDVNYYSGWQVDAAKRREFAYRAGWSFDEHEPR